MAQVFLFLNLMSTRDRRPMQESGTFEQAEEDQPVPQSQAELKNLTHDLNLA